MKKRVLITGSNGLLGQKLVNKLAGRQAIELLATSVGDNRNPKYDGYAYEPMDITDPDRIRRIFDIFEPTEVINTAAMTHVDKCETEQAGCQALNVEAVRSLCEAGKKYGSRIIHVSTDFIFDGEDGPYREKDKPNPLSIYGKSKLDSEQIVLDSGLPFVIARTMLIYGTVADMSRSNIVLWARKALDSGQAINVVNDQWRSPTLSEDLADGIILALMKDKSGIYHLSGPEVLSILEIVHGVAEYFGLNKDLIKEIDSSTLNQKAHRPPKTGFVILKAQTELGFKPRTLQEGLQVVEHQLVEAGEI